MTGVTPRVLLIADKSEDIRLIQESLVDFKDSNLELIVRRGQYDALDALVSERIDAVLLDICLPDDVGMDTLAVLRRRFPAISVIALAETYDRNLFIEASLKSGL